MKKTILTLIFALAIMTFCNAQKIEMEKMFGGYKYTQNGKRMTMGDLVNTMESNANALEFIKKARTNNTFASILGGAGGALVGFPIGQSLGGGDANWTLAGIGAGLIIVAIPISSSANKKAKQAVEFYNSSLNPSSYYEFKPEFKIIANGSGIGLTMNF